MAGPAGKTAVALPPVRVRHAAEAPPRRFTMSLQVGSALPGLEVGEEGIRRQHGKLDAPEVTEIASHNAVGLAA